MATYNKRGYKAPKPEEAKVENELEEVIDTTDSTTAEVFNTLDETASKILVFPTPFFPTKQLILASKSNSIWAKFL